MFKNINKAYTLAEVLACMAIIGIIAAMTLPVMHKNTKNKEINAQKTKATALAIDAWEYGVADGRIKPNKSMQDNFKGFSDYFSGGRDGNFSDKSGITWSRNENKIVALVNKGKDSISFCQSTENPSTLVVCEE